MSIGQNLQKFLTQKISDMKIKKKDFIMKCGIKQPVFNKILDGSLTNPKLTTITKLADFCNASVDEVLGREPKYYSSQKQTFTPVDSYSITNNLLSVVKNTMQDLDISAYQLAKRIHVSSNTLNMFLDPNVSATPGAATTLALANFLDASIDDMIGRRLRHVRKNKS
ncbi:MAG: helix-turn-helix transcriptional regulator [Rickettsia endosymbiont of Glossina mortisans submortisans]|nr:helix-turn-helix transcriptional regulator [Rickettsia endosymbiont of Glossina mortisans submortisans]